MKRILLVLPFVLAACDSGLTGPAKSLVPTAPSLSVARAAEGQHPIEVVVAIVGAPDIGTCNNVWALDSFNKFYTLTPNGGGTYSLQMNYKDGTFVTTGGSNPDGGRATASPGACEGGSDNGNTVGAGITGRMHQEWNATVTAPGTPNRNPNCGRNNANCLTATSFLTAVFGSASFSIGPYSYEGHYEAGRNGTWFDTWENWPLNDTGDITGTKNHERDHGHGHGGHGGHGGNGGNGGHDG